MSVIRCAHCGTTNRAGSNFCNRCGTALRNPEEARPPQQDDLLGRTSPFDPNITQPQRTSATDDLDRAERGAGAQSQDRSQTERTGTDEHYRAEDDGRDAADETAFPPDPQGERPRRLVSGIQGLLDPIRISSNLSGEELSEQGQLTLPLLTVPATQLRRIRALVAEDPILLEYPAVPTPMAPIRLRLPWIILLLTLAVGTPILLFFTAPVGEARQWPGVAEAYTAVDGLPAESAVWILWAYDPSTAGEMDLLARALATHLIERQAQANIISLLPAGLASARRLWRSTADGLVIDEGVGVLNGRTSFIEAAYLPGGAPALALLAASPQEALIGHTERAANWLALTADQRPALTIVLAAQPEEVQQWLELVQTERPLPVLAFTGAGADPILRPYLASGQLQGLVSGFDGAAAYQQLLDGRFARLPSTRYTEQLIAQNWGHFALLLILILGNLRALWLGGERG